MQASWSFNKQKGGAFMTTNTAVQTSAWVERVRALAPLVEKWRDAGEQERHVPGPLFEALRDAGVFRLSVAKAVGGAEVDEETTLRVIEALSQQDGAVGWNVMIASNAAVAATYLPAATLKEVYPVGPDTVIAGALLPKGEAIPVAGGFRLSGRWSFASGCHQAEWMAGASVVMSDGTPRLRPDGRPDIRVFFIRVEECDILDTWRTGGLRGTGSHDWRVSDLFVPEAQSFPILLDGPLEPGALYIKNFAAFAGPRVAAVALGIARDAINAFTALATAKTPALGASSLATQHTTHERVGRAEALLRSGRAFLYETVRELPYSSTWSEALNDDQRASVRLASTHAAQSAAEAVDLMFNAAGTTSIYESSRLERCFRDVHVTTQHISVATSNIEMVGQYLLGLGLQVRR
jgi:alkylation response protein AidB-like acyl-CoA dehydrogenase